MIRGWELTLRSPRFAHRGQLHLAYSNQIAEGSGTITGGLTDFTFSPALSPLDHDQRNTLNVGGDVSLSPGAPTPPPTSTTAPASATRSPASPIPATICPSTPPSTSRSARISASTSPRRVTALNVANRRVEYDNSLTFGGFHWNNPREIYVRASLPVSLLGGRSIGDQVSSGLPELRSMSVIASGC